MKAYKSDNVPMRHYPNLPICQWGNEIGIEKHKGNRNLRLKESKPVNFNSMKSSNNVPFAILSEVF